MPRLGTLIVGLLVLAALAVGLLLARYRVVVIPRANPIHVKSDGLRLAGDLSLGPDERGPLLVLLHPTYHSGRRLHFSRTLYGLLSERFSVATLDSRGFGESEMPSEVKRPEDLDFVSDLERWLAYFSDAHGFAAERIVLVGHSTGAAIVTRYLLEHPDAPLRAVLIFLPRGERIEEVFSSDEPFIRQRWQREMHTKAPIDVEIVRTLFRQMSPERLPEAQQGRPILMVDLAGSAGVDAIQRVYARLGEPKYLHLQAGDDNYFGSRTWLHQNLVRAIWHYTLADRRSMLPLAAAISRFASE